MRGDDPCDYAYLTGVEVTLTYLRGDFPRHEYLAVVNRVRDTGTGEMCVAKDRCSDAVQFKDLDCFISRNCDWGLQADRIGRPGSHRLTGLLLNHRSHILIPQGI